MLPNLHITIEKWKYNEKYGCYVSNMGHIKNKTGELRKPTVARGGYLRFNYKTLDGINKKAFVHRAVLETWKPCDGIEKLTVDHLNHNKRDNSLKNLEWVSEEENCRRANEDYDETPSCEINEDISPDTPYINIDGIDFTYSELEQFILDKKFNNQEVANFRKKVQNMVDFNTLFKYYGHVFSKPANTSLDSLNHYIKLNDEPITKREFNVLCNAIPIDQRATFIMRVDAFRRSGADRKILKYGSMTFKKL